MTEWVEQQICIKFCVKLERSYSYDSECRSYGLLVIGSFIRTMHLLMQNILCEFFFVKHQMNQVIQPSRFGILWILAFPKTKITFEREEISDHPWDSGKYDGAADGNWENCVRCQGAYFEGDWGVIVLCTMFLVPCIIFNKCLYFSYYMTGYLLERLYIGFLAHNYQDP